MMELDMTKECKLCEGVENGGRKLIRVRWTSPPRWYRIGLAQDVDNDVWYLCTDCIRNIKELPS